MGNRQHGNMEGFRGRRHHLPMNITLDSRRRSQYRVYIAREGIRKNVGVFKSIPEAVAARDKAIKELEKQVYGQNG
jgi:hypothetical protein